MSARTWVAALIVALAGCRAAGPPPPIAPAPPAAPATPRCIVFVLGDGMGAAHFALAGSGAPRAAVARMAVAGLVTTASASSPVTDSSAAATAYATGVAIANGRAGVDADGRPLRGIFDAARDAGWATAIVTTASLADASPAGFAAHHTDRTQRDAIADQLAARGLDAWVGTGDDALAARVARVAGRRPGRTLAALEAAAPGPVIGVLPAAEHDADSPAAPLPVLAGWVLDRLLAPPRGCLLLIEHEGADTASHHHAPAHLAAALRSFDATVRVVLDRAARHPDVLVIVAGDHETGGLALLPGGTLAWSTDGHTGAAVPLFAHGPGAGQLAGLLANTYVGRRLLAWIDRASRARGGR